LINFMRTGFKNCIGKITWMNMESHFLEGAENIVVHLNPKEERNYN